MHLYSNPSILLTCRIQVVTRAASFQHAASAPLRQVICIHSFCFINSFCVSIFVSGSVFTSTPLNENYVISFIIILLLFLYLSVKFRERLARAAKLLAQRFPLGCGNVVIFRYFVSFIFHVSLSALRRSTLTNCSFHLSR